MEKQNKGEKTIRKALSQVERKEKRLRQAMQNSQPALWRTVVEEKIPPKVSAGLESAFYKGFSLVFCQGKPLVEKSCRAEKRREEFAALHGAMQSQGGSRQWKQLCKSSRKTDFRNLTVTTLEGIGLGALGIGLPDIVLFLGNLLKGIYEMALSYGFGFESPKDQLLILKMMETALCRGTEFSDKDRKVDHLLTQDTIEITEQQIEAQMKATSAAFAMDMLLLKCIQGIPVAGILGGAANPVYYRKVTRYAERKYRKGYLQKAIRQNRFAGGGTTCRQPKWW